MHLSRLVESTLIIALKVFDTIRELKIANLLIEAILIFSSVYAAFVLEDKRSKRFERELLQQKLVTHLKVMELDSLTFDSRLLGNANSSVNQGLEASMRYHEQAIELLEQQDDNAYLKVYELHKSGKLFWRVIQSATKSQHNLESITENYDHLIIDDSTRHYIKAYIYHTWVINQFAANSDNYIDDLSEFARENYFVFSQLENRADIIEYISHPYYYNTLKAHLNTLQILLGMKDDYFEDFSSIKAAFRREIVLQESLL